MKAHLPIRILITGASGGLGAALARHYAASDRTLLPPALRDRLLLGLTPPSD